MDPFGLLLLSLGPTRMAIREISASFETVDAVAPVDFTTRCASGKPRASGVRAVSKATLRPRRLMRPESAGTVELLTKLATAEGLMVSAQVALSALFELDGSQEAHEALEGRAVDLVLSTADGVPICGIDITSTSGPSFRDHTRVKAFKQAGLALVSIPADADLETVSQRLCEALDITAQTEPESEVRALPAPETGSDGDDTDAEIRRILNVPMVA